MQYARLTSNWQVSLKQTETPLCYIIRHFLIQGDVRIDGEVWLIRGLDVLVSEKGSAQIGVMNSWVCCLLRLLPSSARCPGTPFLSPPARDAQPSAPPSRFAREPSRGGCLPRGPAHTPALATRVSPACRGAHALPARRPTLLRWQDASPNRPGREGGTEAAFSNDLRRCAPTLTPPRTTIGTACLPPALHALP